MIIQDLLKAMTGVGASDLHLKHGRPPMVRVDGEIVAFDLPKLSGAQIGEMLEPIMSGKSFRGFQDTGGVDFSHLLEGVARFRVNMFKQRGETGAVMRRIPLEAPAIASLGLPEVLARLADQENGLVLVAGPAGSGKSTTLAAMIEHINETRPVHVMTIEDPIEFVYEDKMAIVNQRELGADVMVPDAALRAVLRQDPDVILMGEMRDAGTVKFGIDAAESGHLVFATLHANSAPQTLERILDAAPPETRNAVRSQLSLVLRGVVCQRLPRKIGGGRIAALEILVANETIRRLVAENKIYGIRQAMEEGSFHGMQTLDQALYALAGEGVIDRETALANSETPNELALRFKGSAPVHPI